MFEQRAPEPGSRRTRAGTRSVRQIVNQGMFPGGDGRHGRRARAQPAARLDGRRRQPAVLPPRHHEQDQLVPRRDLHRPAPGREAQPAPPEAQGRDGAQIYFIGATNVPVENLDPALTRPGRMGRHVTFRTPTKDDRKDIFDLYLDKVAHDRSSTRRERRDEIARITNGYSPAMIDQICSMALTTRPPRRAARPSTGTISSTSMTVIESGTASRRQVHEDGRPRDRDPRGRPRGRRARLPARTSSRAGSRSSMRGGSRRPPPVFEKEERFGKFQSRCSAS